MLGRRYVHGSVSHEDLHLLIGTVLLEPRNAAYAWGEAGLDSHEVVGHQRYTVAGRAEADDAAGAGTRPKPLHEALQVIPGRQWRRKLVELAQEGGSKMLDDLPLLIGIAGVDDGLGQSLDWAGRQPSPPGYPIEFANEVPLGGHL